MRIIVPMTMFGSVPMPCFVHERCHWEGIVLFIVLVTIFGYVSSSSCFLLLFLPVVSPDKCGEGLVIFPCFVSGVC